MKEARGFSSRLMSGNDRECPHCARPLRADARYCVGCGLEIRMDCPACGQERCWLASLEPGAHAWCPNRGLLLYACETCGRWLLPGENRCPDPACESRSLPTLPVHTGRRADGRGSGAGWVCPSAWGRPGVVVEPLAEERWETPEGLHATCAAYANLYAWAGTALVRQTPQESGAPWRTPLGASSRPAVGLSVEDRLAVTGAAVVLAEERRFLVANLYRSGEMRTLAEGRPLAQAGGPHLWVGWTELEGRPVLQAATVAAEWDLLSPVEIPAPAEAVPTAGGRVVMRDGTAYWPGKDGGVWRLDGPSGSVEPVVRPAEGTHWLWAEADGPRAVRQSMGRLTAGLQAPVNGTFLLEYPAGVGPLLGAYAAGGQVVVAGEKLCALDAATGDRLSPDANRPSGRWMAAATAETDDGGTRLLVLAAGDSLTRLYALDVVSGGERIVWEAPDLVPLALLPVGDSLYVAHSRGVVRLHEERT